MSYTILSRGDLPYDGNTYEFQGIRHLDTNVSFIWVEMPPGGSIRLHRHPYEEIFIIQEGRAAFTVNSETLEARAGQILIVPAGIPHKFGNTGNTYLKQIDIHVSSQFITEWLED